MRSAKDKSIDDFYQNVGILYSEPSRLQYIQEAEGRGAIYAFEDAWGKQKHWLKGEYAYLAPNAASAMLHRFNIKHDMVHEGDGLSPEALEPYHTLFIPNASYLASDSVAALQEWLTRPDSRLIVSGKTNLPTSVLGVARSVPFTPRGYTGWRWTAASPFSDPENWEPFYATSYPGYAANRVTARSDSEVLAQLYEFTGDLQDSLSASPTLIGDAIVRTDQTLYIANQFLEFFGAILQAHVNFEVIRHWYHPTHWGDTLAYFFERILKGLVQPRLWDMRLRSFGTYEGVLSLRHDTDASSDLALLQAEVENLVPATYHVLDYEISADSTTPEQAKTWVQETGKYDFIETSLHNDCTSYEWVCGKKMTEHVDRAERKMGVTLYSLGRHSGCHRHPETLDAMDYLLEAKPDMLGFCTFAYHNMLEYGVEVPERSAQRPTTYATDGSVTIAGAGFWWPYHAVITSVESYKVLRAWDVTHEYDCAYDMVDVLYQSHHSKAARRPRVAMPIAPPWESQGGQSVQPTWDLGENFDRLENGVYTLQYHPLFARDPQLNSGRGSLPWMLYAISLAERLNFWLANKKMLYERMNDYQDIRFRLLATDRIALSNPTGRRIEGLMIESRRPVRRIQIGEDNHIHIVGRRFFTVPPLAAGETLEVQLSDDTTRPTPVIRQANHKGLQILDARYTGDSQEISLELLAIGEQKLLLENLEPGRSYHIERNDGSEMCRPDDKGSLILEFAGPATRWTRHGRHIIPQ